MAKRRGNPNWGKPEPIGPVVPTVTSFEQIVKEYSNYVKWPIRLKGKTLNQSVALWAKRAADVTNDEYSSFYKELMGGFVDDQPLARLHLSKIGVKLTKLRPDQAEYIGVKPEGPFKADHYRY